MEVPDLEYLPKVSDEWHARLNIIISYIPYPPENKPPPPIFSSRHDLDWGGSLFSNMHFPLNISPP